MTEKSFPVVGIGASAGGLEALREMLSEAKAPTGMAFVIVQHLDPNHESMLAQLLDRHTNLDVLQAEGGERLRPETVHIIPPGHGLAIRDGVLELTDFAQPRGLRRPIDDFFISLAQDRQGDAACVILSGTGADGTTGLRAIKENGGVCLAQDPQTARYDGMPLSAVGTGLVDFVKPPAELLDCLSGFFARRASGDVPHEEAEIVADHVDDLCNVLKQAVGHDFSGYKRSTLVRRVERRMQVLGIDTGRRYLDRIRGDAVECEALFRDLLINVTRFFRDAEAFETLRERVIGPLIRQCPADEEVRIWVPGCSSGEEAYSIAMMCAQEALDADVSPAIQIFATDIDERMLEIAREGTYPAAALADIPAPMREKYAIPHAERFSIAPQVRDMIRFSNHSIVKDPPFSRLDLVSLRNLLIYFDDRLQQSVMPLLHYAIRPRGWLFLGPSESVGRFEHLFDVVDHQARLFERRPGAPSYPIDLPAGVKRREGRREREAPAHRASQRRDDDGMLRILDRYAPPSIVLDRDGMILTAYGKLGRYFEFPNTRLSGAGALGLARQGLRPVLSRMLREVRDKGRRLVMRKVEVTSEYGVQLVDVVGDPLKDGTFLFVFRDSAPFETRFEPDAEELESGEQHMDALEDELRVTRHRLRSAVEELETANEELKSSNEEMMSMNEELQSTNEELATVNDELKSKVEQLTVVNADLRNFFDSTELAVIVLDGDLRLRSYTEPAQQIFPLQPSDKGRPLEDVASRLATHDYLDDARSVAQGHPPMQRRILSRDGERSYSLRTLPYRRSDGETEGATLVFTEITDSLEMERRLAREREQLDMAIKAGGIGIWQYDAASGRTELDETERTMLALGEAEARHIDHQMLRVEPEDREAVRAALQRAAEEGQDLEITFRTRGADGKILHIKSFGRRTARADGIWLVGMSIDVTAEYTLAETRAVMLREMNHRVKNLFAIIGSMISMGARSADDLPGFAADMRDRIEGLGRAHSLAATAQHDRPIELADLLDATLAPYSRQKAVEMHGRRIVFDSRYLSPIALILHEWATNSVKYGALGSEDGHLAITWYEQEGDFVLDWKETLPAPLAPLGDSRGFGTLLVETSARQLNASVVRSACDNVFSITARMPASIFDA